MLLLGADREPRVGGQAVIEGVMMRDPSGWSVAVRAPDGSILERVERKPAFATRHRWARIPLIRGAVALVESMVVGFRALSWSAEIFEGRRQAVEGSESLHRQHDCGSDGADSSRESFESGSGVLTTIAALIFAIALFIVIPGAISRAVFARFLSNPLAQSAAEGLLRIAILVGYIAAISRIPEVGRVFEYHGAEHQTIAAYEDGKELTPEQIATYSTRHPRCGTSFLLTVMIVTIAIFALIRGSLPFAVQLAARVVLLPVVAGISYELIRLGWAHRRRAAARLMMVPGLALQAITTKTPDRSQIEVAVRSLQILLGAGEDALSGRALGSDQQS